MFVVVDAVVVELSAVIRDKNHQLTGRVRGVAVVMITVVMFMVLVVLLVLECLCIYIRVCVCGDGARKEALSGHAKRLGSV